MKYILNILILLSFACTQYPSISKFKKDNSLNQINRHFKKKYKPKKIFKKWYSEVFDNRLNIALNNPTLNVSHDTIIWIDILDWQSSGDIYSYIHIDKENLNFRKIGFTKTIEYTDKELCEYKGIINAIKNNQLEELIEQSNKAFYQISSPSLIFISIKKGSKIESYLISQFC